MCEDRIIRRFAGVFVLIGANSAVLTTIDSAPTRNPWRARACGADSKPAAA